MSTTERIRHPTPDRPLPHRHLARRLAGPGWVIMTLACIYIVIIVSRYLTFDPEVYFTEQREAYLQHEFALGVHVLSGVLALLIGPFQFVRRLRHRFVRMHRFFSATYVAAATALGVSGLILRLAGRFGEHRRWMITSFSSSWPESCCGCRSLSTTRSPRPGSSPSRRRTPRSPGCAGSEPAARHLVHRHPAESRKCRSRGVS